jgi:hypothetical protein
MAFMVHQPKTFITFISNIQMRLHLYLNACALTWLAVWLAWRDAPASGMQGMEWHGNA